MTKILFICVHNSGRSQMGEAFVNASGRKDVTAFSAGLSRGSGVLPGAIEVMQELSISMNGHYSKELTKNMFDEADIIVATCDDVCIAIPQEIEDIKRIEKWHIDPPTSNIKEMRAIRDKIKQRTEELLSSV